jgi:hypothetical protein
MFTQANWEACGSGRATNRFANAGQSPWYDGRMNEITYSTEHRPTSAEYIDFLRRSDLGRMYPKKDFVDRIGRLLENASATVTARHDSQLVGVCLGVSDFAYFLFVTDLGVARGYERRGLAASFCVACTMRSVARRILPSPRGRTQRPGPFTKPAD